MLKKRVLFSAGMLSGFILAIAFVRQLIIIKSFGFSNLSDVYYTFIAIGQTGFLLVGASIDIYITRYGSTSNLGKMLPMLIVLIVLTSLLSLPGYYAFAYGYGIGFEQNKASILYGLVFIFPAYVFLNIAITTLHAALRIEEKGIKSISSELFGLVSSIPIMLSSDPTIFKVLLCIIFGMNVTIFLQCYLIRDHLKRIDKAAFANALRELRSEARKIGSIYLLKQYMSAISILERVIISSLPEGTISVFSFFSQISKSINTVASFGNIYLSSIKLYGFLGCLKLGLFSSSIGALIILGIYLSHINFPQIHELFGIDPFVIKGSGFILATVLLGMFLGMFSGPYYRYIVAITSGKLVLISSSLQVCLLLSYIFLYQSNATFESYAVVYLVNIFIQLLICAAGTAFLGRPRIS